MDVATGMWAKAWVPQRAKERRKTHLATVHLGCISPHSCSGCPKVRVERTMAPVERAMRQCKG